MGAKGLVLGGGVAANSLWPRTTIGTAAVQNLLGGDEAMARTRRPELMADAAHAILVRPSREHTGNCYLAEDVLLEEGVTVGSDYRFEEGSDLDTDIFVDEPDPPATASRARP